MRHSGNENQPDSPSELKNEYAALQQPARNFGAMTCKYFRVMIFVCLSFAACLQTGCNRIQSPPLRLMVWTQPDEQQKLEKSLLEFTRQTKVLVELIVFATEEECRSQYEVRFRKNEAPDVCMLSSKDATLWLEKKFFTDLLPFHPEEKTLLADAVQPFMHHKQLIALPRGWSVLVLYYNRDVFERHGIPLPRTSWDWGDLLGAAQMLTVLDKNRKNTIQYGLEISPTVETWLPFLWGNYGEAMRENGSWALTDPQFTQSNQQALAYYADFVRIYRVSPFISSAYSGSLHFLEGTAAMTIGHRALGAQLLTTKIAWDVVPIPHACQTSTLLEVEAYAISSQSTEPSNAWKLVSFLTRETAQAGITQRGTHAPSRKGLLDSKLFLDFPGVRAVANTVFVKSLPFAKTVPRTAQWAKISKILTEEMTILMSNKNQTARATLEKMQVRINEIELKLETPKKPAQPLKVTLPAPREPSTQDPSEKVPKFKK
jgi:multiple sugar transport system substrate-binding protein